MKLQFAAPCLFGLESELAFELKSMGAQQVQAENGRVKFSGGPELVARANIRSAVAERILLVLEEFDAFTFEDLFQGVRCIPWGDYIGRTDAFPVKGHSLKSQLHSVPDCQSIIKKAVAESLKERYHVSWLEETGNPLQIQFSILKDHVSIMLDTSGWGLHKRGYRRHTGSAAPLKETLAAGIARLARVKENSTVYDPCCGSGTLLIESALKALNISPGAGRRFASESWGFLPDGLFQVERQAAYAQIRRQAPFRAYGSDLDGACAALAKENLKKSGLSSRGAVSTADLRDFAPQTDTGIVLCNPPYGERLSDRKSCEQLYAAMGKVFVRRPGFSYYIITSHEGFEEHFGRKADKKRKLYNGMIRCDLYMYFR